MTFEALYLTPRTALVTASTGVLRRACTQTVAVRRNPHALALMSCADTFTMNSAARMAKASIASSVMTTLLSTAANILRRRSSFETFSSRRA